MSSNPPPGIAASSAEAPRLRVGFVTLRNFTLLPFAGFMDVLRLATDDGDRSRQRACHWTVMSADGEAVRASCGTRVAADSEFVDPSKFDYIVTVGGLLHEGPQSDDRTDAYLSSAAEAGVPLIGLCTAVFTLIRLGLMSERQCCVSWYHYWDLNKAFPDVKPVADRLFVADGPRITCAGGTAAIDLAAWLVKRHLDKAVATKALHILLADGARPADSPQPHVVVEHQAHDSRLEAAINIIEQNLAHRPSIDSIARRVGVSRRQLERIFRNEMGMSPRKYSLGRRLRQGHHLLTQTDHSITGIAYECGFADASHFSRHVRTTFGASPQTVRDAAQATGRGSAAGASDCG